MSRYLIVSKFLFDVPAVNGWHVSVIQDENDNLFYPTLKGKWHDTQKTRVSSWEKGFEDELDAWQDACHVALLQKGTGIVKLLEASEEFGQAQFETREEAIAAFLVKYPWGVVKNVEDITFCWRSPDRHASLSVRWGTWVATIHKCV